MPTDLEYFCESELNAYCIEDFGNLLPNNLEEMFDKCVKNVGMRYSVLQGYRGPPHMCDGSSGDSKYLDPVDGLQEIKFWYGLSKRLNFIPVMGQLLFITGRFVQTLAGEMKWISLYFDSKTGECFGHKKYKACLKLREKGIELFQKGEHVEAVEYLKNAFHSYVDTSHFFSNCFEHDLNRACDYLNVKGDEFFRDGRFAEAAEYFEKAFLSCSCECQNKQTFLDNKFRADAEIKATNLNAQGDRLFAQGEYTQAQEKYSNAYCLSQVKTQRSLYLASIDRAKAELRSRDRAINDDLSLLEISWSQAWEAENDEPINLGEESRIVFQEIKNVAEKKSTVFSGVSGIKQYAYLAALKIEGNDLFKLGLESKQSGLKLLQEAQNLNSRRIYERSRGKFEEAKGIFEEAFAKFEVGDKHDKRFASSVATVQKHINEVVRLIQLTDQQSEAERSEFNYDSDSCLSSSWFEHDFGREPV